jgi:hypothetical protein
VLMRIPDFWDPQLTVVNPVLPKLELSCIVVLLIDQSFVFFSASASSSRIRNRSPTHSHTRAKTASITVGYILYLLVPQYVH